MKCSNAERQDYTLDRLYLPCLTPDDLCEGDLTDTVDDPPHHYGCECDNCVAYYRSLK